MSLPTPRLSTRGTAGYSFAELYLALGPQAIGETGDNSLPTLIGRVWALVLDADGRLRLFQRAELAATWVEQTTLLPPLFAETHPPERRRFSIAFDQSARANVAYEEDGAIYLTRWDTATSSYLQNVTVSGVDPVVVFDATFAYDVTVSDVLLFYLDAATRSKLRCRVQRDLYLAELEIYDYTQPVVLDRVTRLPIRYQALASDEAGDPLEDEAGRVGLLSALYPYPAASGTDTYLDGSAAAGDYVLTVLYREHADDVELGLSGASASGAYTEPVIETEGADALDLALDGSLAAGAYVELVINEAVDAEAELALDGSAAAGDYVLTVLYPGTDPENVELGLSGAAAGGSYDPV